MEEDDYWNLNYQVPSSSSALVGNNPEPANTDWFTKDSAFGGKTNTGWLTGGAQALSGLAAAWTGMQQLDLAKDQFAFQKQAYATNLANQATITNSAVEDKWKRRAAVGGSDAATSQYGTLADYTAKRSVSGTI